MESIFFRLYTSIRVKFTSYRKNYHVASRFTHHPQNSLPTNQNQSHLFSSSSDSQTAKRTSLKPVIRDSSLHHRETDLKTFLQMSSSLGIIKNSANYERLETNNDICIINRTFLKAILVCVK